MWINQRFVAQNAVIRECFKVVKKSVDVIDLAKLLNIGAIGLIKQIIIIQLKSTSDAKSEYKQ